MRSLLILVNEVYWYFSCGKFQNCSSNMSFPTNNKVAMTLDIREDIERGIPVGNRECLLIIAIIHYSEMRW